MFNQLTPAEVVAAIGASARRAARHDGAMNDFERDQLMSAYSATRHLAAELAGYERPLREFTAATAAAIRATADPRLSAELRGYADRIESSREPAGLAGEVGDVLTALRQSNSDAAAGLRTEIHRHLRALSDREVDVLADALG